MPTQDLTLDDIRGMTRDIITPAIAARVLGCDPHWIRVAARDRPELLGFPVCRVGNRTKIPRLGFIAWCEGKELESDGSEDDENAARTDGAK